MQYIMEVRQPGLSDSVLPATAMTAAEGSLIVRVSRQAGRTVRDFLV